MNASCLVVAVLVAAVPARAFAGSGIILPPMEIDLGETAPIGHTVTGVATDMMVGLHWASLAWKPTHFDIGVGFIHSSRAVLDPSSLARTAGDSTTVVPTSDPSFELNGGYLQLGSTLVSHPHWRTWIAARGELLHASFDGRDFSSTGAALRLATELYVPMHFVDHGAVIGSFAIGLYVEASHRDLPTELGPNGITTGLLFRIPFVVAGS